MKESSVADTLISFIGIHIALPWIGMAFLLLLYAVGEEGRFWGFVQTVISFWYMQFIINANWNQGVEMMLVIPFFVWFLGGLTKITLKINVFGSDVPKKYIDYFEKALNFIGLISKYFIKIMPIILIALGYYGFYNYGSKLGYQVWDSLIVLAIFTVALYLSLKQFPSVKKIFKKILKKIKDLFLDK